MVSVIWLLAGARNAISISKNANVCFCLSFLCSIFFALYFVDRIVNTKMSVNVNKASWKSLFRNYLNRRWKFGSYSFAEDRTKNLKSAKVWQFDKLPHLKYSVTSSKIWFRKLPGYLITGVRLKYNYNLIKILIELLFIEFFKNKYLTFFFRTNGNSISLFLASCLTIFDLCLHYCLLGSQESVNLSYMVNSN